MDISKQIQTLTLESSDCIGNNITNNNSLTVCQAGQRHTVAAQHGWPQLQQTHTVSSHGDESEPIIAKTVGSNVINRTMSSESSMSSSNDSNKHHQRVHPSSTSTTAEISISRSYNTAVLMTTGWHDGATMCLWWHHLSPFVCFVLVAKVKQSLYLSETYYCSLMKQPSNKPLIFRLKIQLENIKLFCGVRKAEIMYRLHLICSPHSNKNPFNWEDGLYLEEHQSNPFFVLPPSPEPPF